MSDQPRSPYRQWAAKMLADAGAQLFGMDEVIRLCIVAYCAGGHVLLEGNPGFGKTTLVRRLAAALGLQEGRIQFTPDLMPSDITGTFMPRYASNRPDEWAFEPGPIFASFLLADEINRATPKTQSALLEAMAEGQVTVLGQTYRLPQPFVVMATQNPLDHSGTYALPEAQADRFMFKLLMPVPDAAAAHKIVVDRRPIAPAPSPTPALSDGPPIAPRRLLFAASNPDQAPREAPDPREHALRRPFDEARRSFVQRADLIDSAPLLPAVEWHLVTLFLASNRRYAELERLGVLSGDQLSRVRFLADELLTPGHGLGPRALINLDRAARAWAFCFSTLPSADNTPPPDGNDFAHVLIPVLRHRLKTTFGWEELYARREPARRAPFPLGDDPLGALIADFALATAPTGQITVRDEPTPEQPKPEKRLITFDSYYRELLRKELATVLGAAGGQR